MSKLGKGATTLKVALTGAKYSSDIVGAAHLVDRASRGEDISLDAALQLWGTGIGIRNVVSSKKSLVATVSDGNTESSNSQTEVGEKNNFKISENARDHLKNVQKITTKRGVSGGHNRDELLKAFTDLGVNPNEIIISENPHPTIEGVYDVRYQLPKKDKTGNVAKPVTFKNDYEPKTVYDPTVWSDRKSVV